MKANLAEYLPARGVKTPLLTAVIREVAAGAGSPKTGLAAAAPLVIGAAAKTLENALARRNMREVDTMVRQRSPLYQEQAAGGLNARDMAMLRALLPGMIANQQPPPRLFGAF